MIAAPKLGQRSWLRRRLRSLWMMGPRVGESGSSQRHWSTLTIEQIAQFMLDLQTQVAKLNAAVFPQNMFTEETPQPEASHDSLSESTFSPDEQYQRVKRLKKGKSVEQYQGVKGLLYIYMCVSVLKGAIVRNGAKLLAEAGFVTGWYSCDKCIDQCKEGCG